MSVARGYTHGEQVRNYQDMARTTYITDAQLKRIIGLDMLRLQKQEGRTVQSIAEQYRVSRIHAHRLMRWAREWVAIEEERRQRAIA